MDVPRFVWLSIAHFIGHFVESGSTEPAVPMKCEMKERFVKPCEFGVKVPRVWAEQSAQSSK
jgi:hypothetical protein